jgi:hypothetical protein
MVKVECRVVSVCQLLSRCASRPCKKEMANWGTLGTVSRALVSGDFPLPLKTSHRFETNFVGGLEVCTIDHSSFILESNSANQKTAMHPNLLPTQITNNVIGYPGRYISVIP